MDVSQQMKELAESASQEKQARKAQLATQHSGTSPERKASKGEAATQGQISYLKKRLAKTESQRDHFKSQVPRRTNIQISPVESIQDDKNNVRPVNTYIAVTQYQPDVDSHGEPFTRQQKYYIGELYCGLLPIMKHLVPVIKSLSLDKDVTSRNPSRIGKDVEKDGNGDTLYLPNHIDELRALSEIVMTSEEGRAAVGTLMNLLSSDEGQEKVKSHSGKKTRKRSSMTYTDPDPTD